MVPQFEEKMKNTPVGQISRPFQTQYGWHILEVTGVREKDMTQEYQERMARQILGERQFDSELDSGCVKYVPMRMYKSRIRNLIQNCSEQKP